MLRARSQLDRWVCGWRGLLLRITASIFDDASARRVAAPAGLPHLPTPRPSRCSRGHDSRFRLRASSPEGSEQQRVDVCCRRTESPGRSGAAVLRATSTGGQAPGFCSFLRHRSLDAAKGAFDGGWARASGSHCVWHECQWQAASPDIGAGSCRILRDCTRGSLTGVYRPETKIQSDPHGDMRSQAEMTWPLKQNRCAFQHRLLLSSNKSA